MNVIPESEARALLANSTYCDLSGDWLADKVQPGTLKISSGLVDAQDIATKLLVELQFRRSRKTGIVTYLFSVFRRSPYGRDRVYQLDVRQSKKPIRNVHDRSHVHIGSLRVSGHDEWAQWSFEDVINYFCNSANITISPRPVHPENSELRSKP